MLHPASNGPPRLPSPAEEWHVCSIEQGGGLAGTAGREGEMGRVGWGFGWGEMEVAGVPQDKLKELAVLVRWRRPDMVSMWLLEGLSGVVQPTACGKRWW